MTVADLYAAIAQTIFLASMGATALAAMVWVVLYNRELQRGRKLLAPWNLALMATLPVGAALGIVTLAADINPNPELYIQFIIGLVIFGFMAIPCAFVSPPEGTPIHPPFTLPQGAAWVLATIAFSLGGFYGMVELLKLAGIEVTMVENAMASLMRPDMPLFYLSFILLAIAAAVIEEVVFRGGMHGLLRHARLPAWAVIAITSVLWAAGHAGAYVEPVGVKEAHILLLGALFGYARERHGLRAAIVLHVANNGLALLLGYFFPELLEL